MSLVLESIKWKKIKTSLNAEHCRGTRFSVFPVSLYHSKKVKVGGSLLFCDFSYILNWIIHSYEAMHGGKTIWKEKVSLIWVKIKSICQDQLYKYTNGEMDCSNTICEDRIQLKPMNHICYIIAWWVPLIISAYTVQNGINTLSMWRRLNRDGNGQSKEIHLQLGGGQQGI